VARLTSERVELLVDGGAEAYELAALSGLAVRRVQAPGWKVPAASGVILGGVGTYALLHSGGSTSRCDRSSNQDAMSSRECAGLTVLGGLGGAGLGFLVSRLLRTERWISVPVGRIDVTVGWRR